MKLLILGLILAVFCFFWYRQRFITVLVYDYETGRFSRDGQFVNYSEPGRYRIRKERDQIIKVDHRSQSVTVPAQSIFTRDSAQIKTTLIATYQIKDADIYLTQFTSSEAQFYLELQLVLREYISKLELEYLLSQDQSLNLDLLALAQPRLAKLGIDLLKLDIKDLMLPAELRAAYAQKLLIQKQAEVKLEQARSEQASLRKLANAARLLDQNPSLLSLRLMHSLEQSKVSHSIHFSGSTASAHADPESTQTEKQ